MRYLKIIGFTLFVVVLLPVLLVQFFGDPIARRVVDSLNQDLQTKLEVGTYDLSLLRSFPNLSADLHDVHVTGSDGSTLLQANRLACLLDLSSLFGKIRIHGIQAEDGKLQLFTDRDGNTNYQLTHTSVGEQYQPLPEGGAAGAGSTEVAIETARLRNITVVYQDARLQTDAQFTVSSATFSGDFASREYVLTTEADLTVAYFDQGGQRYLDQVPLSLSGQTTVDHAAGAYRFTPLRLRSGDLDLAATGQLTPTKDGLTTALELTSQSGNLEDIFALLPSAYAAALGELETRGELLLAATVEGDWTDRAYPRIDGQLTFTEGRLSSPRMNVGARDVNLRASFAYLDGPRGGVQTFAVEQLTGTFGGEPFDLKLRLEDLEDPRITFSAEGSLPLSTLPAFLSQSALTEGGGTVHFQNLQLSGRYADMIAPRRVGRVKSTGSVAVEDGRLLINDRELNLPSGTLTLDDNRLTVNDLAVTMDRTHLTFSGEATNLIPVLFADSLNTWDAVLQFTASLRGERLDIGEVLALSEPSEAEQTAAAGSGTTDSLTRSGIERRARITDLLNGRFEADIEIWEWDKLHGADFQGQLVFSPGQLDVRGVTEAMDGQFRVDASTYFQYTNRIEARLTARGVDVEEFFAQSENFDQEVLTADNLRGEMNGRMLLHVYYDTLGAVDYDLLRVQAGLEILDGELRDFELLENFAFALKSGDLERVRFTRLANYFEIRDRTIYIPAMFIQSSAINLTLSGSHTFDQYLEYYVKVNAGQVIANKISRHDDRLEVLPARNGLFNLYYTIEGPLETYTVASDKGAVKDNLRRSAYRRDRIRELLEERFATPIELWPTNDGEEDL